MEDSVYDDVKQLILDNVQFIKQLTEEINDENIRESLKKFNEETVDQRLENVEKLIRLKTRQLRVDDIAKKALECSTLDEVDSKFDAELNTENKRRSNIKQTLEYKNLKKRLLNAHDSNAEQEDEHISLVDIVETGGNIVSMHDPWSKMLMTNPVRNIKCGHHYDQSSVNSVIKNNIGIRCPVVGCASKAFIQPNHLVDDFELLHKIKTFKAEQDAQQSDEE